MNVGYKEFKQLHNAENLFVLPNAWNAKSALLFQEQAFSAIATSSAAVAGSLGYEDGEQMPLEDYLVIIKRIITAVKIPVTVDIEMGYGTTNEKIYSNIHTLINMGVAGINIEDSTVTKSGRALKEVKEFAKTIAYLKNKLVAANTDLFMNVRCDTYLLEDKNKQKETKSRLDAYEASGADGIFLPCICGEDDIAEAVSNTKLPLNVMCIPGLPGFDRLNQLGVKRVSMGPFLFNKVYDTIDRLSQAILAKKSFSPVFS